MHLLVDPRHARQNRRSHDRHDLCEPQRVGTEGDRVARIGPEEVHQPSEVVGQRQVDEHHVVGDRELRDAIGARGHLVVVAVADHAGLGRAGRARRVDEREEVVLLDRRLGLGERIRLLGCVGPAAGAKPVEVGERDDVGEARVCDLRPLFLVLDQHAHRVRMLEHVDAVLRRAVRVDGRAHGADQAECVVEQRPLERRLGQDSERVALANAQCEQAVGELVHGDCGLVPADLAPTVGLLHEVRGIRAPRGDGLPPQPCDRAAAARLHAGLGGRCCRRLAQDLIVRGPGLRRKARDCGETGRSH